MDLRATNQLARPAHIGNDICDYAHRVGARDLEAARRSMDAEMDALRERYGTSVAGSAVVQLANTGQVETGSVLV